MWFLAATWVVFVLVFAYLLSRKHPYRENKNLSRAANSIAYYLGPSEPTRPLTVSQQLASVSHSRLDSGAFRSNPAANAVAENKHFIESTHLPTTAHIQVRQQLTDAANKHALSSPSSQPKVLMRVRIQHVVDADNTHRLRVASVVVDCQETLSSSQLSEHSTAPGAPSQRGSHSLSSGRASRKRGRSSELDLPADGVPTRGLLIQPEPLDKILVGLKTLELRSAHNRQLGTVALIRKGSKQIEGVADIVESIGPMDIHEMHRRSAEHGVEPSRIPNVMDKGWTIGWRLVNVRRLAKPVPYVHKGMSRVNLDDQAIADLRQALKSAVPVPRLPPRAS